MADCYTELEKAVVVLVENFYKYVSKHSLVKNKISKSSFRKMLQRELNHMLTVPPLLLSLPALLLTVTPPPVCPTPPLGPCSVTPPCALLVWPRRQLSGLILRFSLSRVLSGSSQALLTPVSSTGHREPEGS